MDYSVLGIEPIAGGQPAGSDVRYEEAFDALQLEIDKLGSPAARETFSWAEVVDLASGILKENSKDILVASYLCVGLIHVNGVEGLDAASKIYDDLIETFWDNLFPPAKRMNGRVAAIDWWIDKTELALGDAGQLNLSSEISEKIIERLNRIGVFLEKNPDFKLTVTKLFTQVKALTVKTNGNEKAAQPQINEKPDSQSEIDKIVDIDLANAADILKNLNPLFQKIRNASKVVREEKKHNPQSYRWLRFGLWETVKSAPASVGGVTKLPPPAKPLLIRLEGLRAEEEWEELLLSSESALNNAKNIFLLDLNWYSAEALLNLGPRFKKAYDIVCHETNLFARRLPGLEELVFADGTAFAGDDTKLWLRNLAGGSETGNDISKLLAENDTIVATAIQQADKLVKEKADITDAVNYLQDKIKSSFSGKDALLLRLGLVSILIKAKNEKVVIAHLDKIFEDVVTFRLDLWEPDIALVSLKSIYSVFKKQADKKYIQKAEEVFQLITTISTVDAMKL